MNQLLAAILLLASVALLASALDKVVREAQNEMLDKVAESGLIGKDGELYKSLRRIEP